MDKQQQPSLRDILTQNLEHMRATALEQSKRLDFMQLTPETRLSLDLRVVVSVAAVLIGMSATFALGYYYVNARADSAYEQSVINKKDIRAQSRKDYEHDLEINTVKGEQSAMMTLLIRMDATLTKMQDQKMYTTP